MRSEPASEIWLRLAAQIALSCYAGYAIAHGDWDSAWKASVLVLLTMIYGRVGL